MFEIIEGGSTPQIKTEFSSSADLCSRTEVTIHSGETKVIPLGIKINLVELENLFIDNLDYRDSKAGIPLMARSTKEDLFKEFLLSHFLELKIRSSLSFELIVANGVGEIDLDYPKEIGLIVHFPFKFDNKLDLIPFHTIKAGERVAQIKLMEHKNFLMPSEYRLNKKRTGGYGSTNKEKKILF